MAKQKVSVLLNGGVDEQAFDELGGPIASQGASVVLRESRNTRLSARRGTCTRAPDSASVNTLAYIEAHGVVSCSAGRNTVVFTRPALNIYGLASSMVLASDGTTASPGGGYLTAPLDYNLGNQNAYFPCQLTNAGAIPSVTAVAPPATCFDPVNQWYWTAYYAPTDDGSVGARVFITVTDTDGGVIVAPCLVDTIAGSLNGWIGITCHGASGIRLWLQYSNAVTWAVVTRVDNIVYLPSGYSTAVAPSTDDTAACVVSGMLLDADGVRDTTHEAYAYLATSQPLFPNNGRVTRVNINTNASTSVDVLTGLTGDGAASVCFSKLSGSYYVGMAFHATTLDKITTQIVTATLGLLTFPASISAATDRVKDVAVQFLSSATAGGDFLMAVTSTVDGSFSGAIPCACSFFSQPIASSTLDARDVVPYMALRSQGAALRFDVDEQYPVFDLVPYYGDDNETPIDLDAVLDPSATLWLVGGLSNYSPVARYGVVRGNIAPIRVKGYAALPQGPCVVGPKVHATYLKDIVGSSGQDDYPARYVELDFSPFQPPVTHDKDGVAFAAAALPVQWDGIEVVEIGGPLFAPKILTYETGGSGPAYPAGDYQFSAHFTWTDAGGLQHRSAPVGLLHTSVGGSPLVYTTPAVSLKNGIRQTAPDVQIFASEVGPGATQHLLPGRPYQFSTSTLLSDVDLADTSRQQLYSSGTANEEQTPQPPPPAQDICIIGDRCWVLDAEIRSRAVYSKRRISGKGYEFHPTYEVLLPSGAGKTIAVREWQGGVVIFTEFAIYGISGGGPDNLVGNPSGGNFSAPQRLASVGCTSRESVIVTPKGIFFQRDNDIMSFTGGEPAAVLGVQPSESVLGAVLLRDDDEVAFLVDSEWKVYNYAVNRWTLWDAPTDGFLVHTLPFDPSRTLVLKSGVGPWVHVLDADVPSTTAEMSWTTDWIVLGGDFQDAVLLHQLVLSARRSSAHGGTIEVYTNYDETTPTTSLDFGPGLITTPRYDLWVQPKEQFTRAVKVKIIETDVTGETRGGMQPICLTFVFTIEGMLQERARLLSK